MITYHGEGTCWGKKFQLNRITSLICNFLVAYLATFSRQLYSGKDIYLFSLFELILTNIQNIHIKI